MKDLEKYLKVLSDGMKTLAKGFESVAEKVERLAHTQGVAKPEPKRASRTTAKETTPKPGKDKAAKKAPKSAPKGAPRKATEPTATDQVYRIISRNKNGVNTETIQKNTGFNAKKVQNIIYKLKKQGKIKSTVKGVYVKA